MGATLALGGSGYAAPLFEMRDELVAREDAVWWVVVVGFAFAVALAWATWCRLQGGDAEISFGWSGFKVVCRG